MIGIYGGTFDPVHYGHLRTALEAKEIFALEQMRLLPCGQAALKTTDISTPEKRLEMLLLATQNHTELRIDRRELERKGVSYMIDTLKSIRNEIADTPLLLFMGTDAFQNIKAWYQWQYLFDYAHIVVMTRPNYAPSDLCLFLNSKVAQSKDELSRKPAGHLLFQTVSQLDISASAIRQIIVSGKNPGFLLPDKVIDYIKQNKLYTCRQ